jgi:hypothetical protein
VHHGYFQSLSLIMREKRDKFWVFIKRLYTVLVSLKK